jgi:regulator of replication initiation timing
MLMADAQMKRNYTEIKLTWLGLTESYRELKPIEIKKELKYLREQNKMLNLSLNNVQEQLEKIKQTVTNGK